MHFVCPLGVGKSRGGNWEIQSFLLLLLKKEWRDEQESKEGLSESLSSFSAVLTPKAADGETD